MRPFRFLTSSRTKRWLVATAFVLLAAGLLLLRSLGTFLDHQDPLQHADAIYVLGGSWVDRWLEATNLRRAGYAPLIILSRGAQDVGAAVLAARGIRMPDAAEIARDVMITQMGLPPSAVQILPEPLDNTADEAAAIRSRARQAGWHAIIVITDPATTRRAGFAFRRALGPSIKVIVRAPRITGYDAAHWWRTRQDFRSTFYEAPKLLAYWLGLKG